MEDDVGDDEKAELDLSELPDCYAETDRDKTSRIIDLERQVEILTKQLEEARNQVNTLTTQVEKHKKVQSQVKWLIEQFRHTLSGLERSSSSLLPPPAPPIPPSPLLLTPEPNDISDEDWDTLEEEDPKESDLNKLLANVTPRTLISDIYKKWKPN